MILDERGFSGFVEWAQRVAPLLQQYGTPPDPTTEDDWQRWGANLGLLPGIRNTPSPYFYGDWREWVQDLNRTVQGS